MNITMLNRQTITVALLQSYRTAYDYAIMHGHDDVVKALAEEDSNLGVQILEESRRQYYGVCGGGGRGRVVTAVIR